MRDGFIKVAAGVPAIGTADCRRNAEQIFGLMRTAAERGVRVMTLPELCLTGCTCGDLFFQNALIRGAEEALLTVLQATRPLDMLTAVGLPVLHEGRLYNCAALLCRGELLGVAPKAVLTEAERRWFAPGRHVEGTVSLCGRQVPFSSQLTLRCEQMPELTVCVRLGGDSGPDGGAAVVLNPAAEAETAGGMQRRRAFVQAQSARRLSGWLRADAGEGESATDLVYGGHCLAAECGELLAEHHYGAGLAVSEFDTARIAYARRRAELSAGHYRRGQDAAPIPFSLEPATTVLTRRISPTPFIPEDEGRLAQRCEEVLLIAALGLKRRLEHTKAACAVIGLSGGLDSTLAILIAALAMQMLGRPTADIVAVTMPCFGTTERTRDNAVMLAERLGATLRRIDISATVRSHFADIGQDAQRHDAAFENAQARERTQVLMDIANQTGGIVVGTGDLSELALGWCTYNGDHMSMYGVNASIPKTLVRRLVRYVCRDKEEEDARLSSVLADILDTPVSPELLPAVSGQIAQKTEDLIGPYELHDFFLYYFLRWGSAPRKLLRLAERAFSGQYDRAEILKWMKLFFRRFFSQQFKRSCMPDGPAVGSVGLSPRAGWKMPSDAAAELWLAELEELE